MFLALVGLVGAVLAGAGCWQVALVLAASAVGYLVYCKVSFDRSRSNDTPPDGR